MNTKLFKIIVLPFFVYIVLYNVLLNTSLVGYCGWSEAGGDDCSAEQIKKGCVDLHIPLYDPIYPNDPTTGFIKTSNSGNVTIFTAVSKYMYKISAYLAGTILTIYIIIAGLQMIVSKNPNTFVDAKSKLIAAIEGIILLILAGYILHLINPNFFELT